MPAWLAPACFGCYGTAFLAPYFLVRGAKKINYWYPEYDEVVDVCIMPEVCSLLCHMVAV